MKNNNVSTPLTKSRKGGFFTNLLSQNCFVILAFFCSAVIMTLVLYCFDVVPFGDITILRMDLYHQYGPLFAELYERIKSGGSLFYSWNTGMGGGFLGNFFNYLASPLAFVIFFFDHADLPDAISLMILLKCAFASAIFCYYLKSSFGIHSHVTSAFGVLYSFCGFFIAYYWNIMWIDAFALFPLVILGIERIIDRRKYCLYLFTLAVILITNYYMAYMICIFSVIYFFYRYFITFGISDTFSGKQQKSIGARLRDSRFVTSAATFGFASLGAGMLALFALLPTLYILRSCSATSGSWPSDIKYYYSIFDFLANHLASLNPTIRSSGDDVLPNVYCGIITLILVPVYLLTKSISFKEKTLTVCLLGLLYFSFNVNYLNYIWHGLHFPNDLPYRFTFIYSFILLTLAFKAFKRIREVSAKELFLCGLGVVFFIVIVQEIGSKNVQDVAVLTSLAFAVLYTLLLLLFRSKKYQETSIALLILCSVISEAAIADSTHFAMTQTKESYSGDYSSFSDIKQHLDDYDDSKFYRMELSNLRTRMDPAWYNYNGISTFSSMASESLSNLQSHLGIYGNFINSYTYNPQTPVYNAMTGIKYIVKKTDSDGLDNTELYTKRFINDTFTAYENNYTLPIAYCAGSGISSWDHDGANPFDVQSDYFEKASGISNVFTEMETVNIDYTNIEEFYAGFDINEYSMIKINDSEDGSVMFTFAPKAKQNCYLYVKSRSVDSISVRHDGFDRSQSIDEAYILDLGIVEEGENVYVTIPLNDESNSGNVKVSAYGVNMGAFEKGYNVLKSGQLNITDFSDTHIEGSFTADSECLLYTSIPYDEGWTVKIDGKKINPDDEFVKIGEALLAIKVKGGIHKITMDYTPAGLKLGCAVSALTLLVIIFILATAPSRRRKRELRALMMSHESFVPEDDITNYDESDKFEVSDVPSDAQPFIDSADVPPDDETAAPSADCSENFDIINPDSGDNSDF